MLINDRANIGQAATTLIIILIAQCHFLLLLGNDFVRG